MDEAKEHVEDDELETGEPELLPDREAMSLLNPLPPVGADGDLLLPNDPGAPGPQGPRGF